MLKTNFPTPEKKPSILRDAHGSTENEKNTVHKRFLILSIREEQNIFQYKVNHFLAESTFSQYFPLINLLQIHQAEVHDLQ